MGKPIPLELHHKDCNHYNNNMDNLIILCSNCHMQSHNYSNVIKEKPLGKRPNRKWNYVEKKKKEFICKNCGKTFYSIQQSQKYCSVQCCHNTQVRINITKDELINSFVELRYFKSVGKKYNVCDNTIRKLCKKLNIPSNSKDMELFLQNIQG